MIRYRSCLLVLSLLMASCVTLDQKGSGSSAEEKIAAIMKMQTDCWNDGDIDCFMRGYWRSDSLRFIGKDGLIKGWQRTLDRYKRSYPDKAAMGFLKFDIISTEVLGQDYALVIVKFSLQREGEELKGIFTLIWKNMNGEWVIILDNTS